jgi:Tfp pilus assembly protein PilO
MTAKIMLKKYLPKIMLVWAGFFFIAVGLYFFVLIPQKDEKKRLSDEYQTLSAQYQEVLRLARGLNKTRMGDDVAKLAEEAGLFIINPTNVSNLTLDISGLSRKFNLSSTIIKNQEERPIQNCSRIAMNPLHISFYSSFNQFFSLLNNLERHAPIVFIDTFSIKTRQDQPDNEVTIFVDVFVSKVPAPSNNEKITGGI